MVLETVVKVIRESSDSNDVLIRYGGDEFVLLSQMRMSRSFTESCTTFAIRFTTLRFRGIPVSTFRSASAACTAKIPCWMRQYTVRMFDVPGEEQEKCSDYL